MFPLVENPGARRAYHREWLLSFVGVKSRAVVEPWRDHFVAVEETDADD